MVKGDNLLELSTNENNILVIGFQNEKEWKNKIIHQKSEILNNGNKNKGIKSLFRSFINSFF